MADHRTCDVLVAGGGPAGATIAALLAQNGRHVVVLERERFPRFHIGESLLPFNVPLFERLGIAEEVKRIGVYKPGAELISDAHQTTATFRFADNPQVGIGHSYHVLRSDFDKLLLDNSRRLGAEVIEGARVTDVMLEAGNPQVTAIGPDAAPVQCSARYLVDATGRDTLIANRLGLKRIDKHNNTAALFGHFRNVARRGGDHEGMITVHLFEHGWFWVIPLPDEVTSVGLVGTSTFFKARTGGLDAFFAGAVAACPSLAERMTQAERIGPLAACADYSYDTRHCVGARHIMVGDAAAFIDPLFSSGVMMAMSSAVFAAEVVEAALDGEVRTPELMREYERKIRRSLEALSWLIYRINAPVLRDIFMAPFDLFDTRHGLIAMLAGDFYAQRALLSPLRRVQAVYGCLWVLAKFGLRLGSRGLNWGGGN